MKHTKIIRTFCILSVSICTFWIYTFWISTSGSQSLHADTLPMPAAAPPVSPETNTAATGVPVTGTTATGGIATGEIATGTAGPVPSNDSFVWTRKNLPPLPEYVCQRPVDAIKIDGRLTEASWQKARSTPNFFVFKEAPGQTYKTYAKLLWDDTNLYLAFSCADPDVRATRKQRDDDIFNEDCVEFFLMEQYYGARYNHFLEYEVNPYGTRFDAYNLGAFQGVLDWDSRGWKSAVQVNGTLNNASDTDKGWTVEMVIPFRDFYATVFLNEKRAIENNNKPARPWRPVAGERWRCNLYRLKYTAKGARYFAWSPPHLYPSMGFHEIDRYGTLLFSMDASGEKLK